MTAKKIDVRFAALWRFGLAITLLTLLGHSYLGFEQAWAQPAAALSAAYSVEILLELIDAWSKKRSPRFIGGWRAFLSFILPAHITGLAVAMLLYANDRLPPFALAAAIAVGSKTVFRVRVGSGTRHFLNPSNFGITLVLLLFPWVGIAPPYHFTENLTGSGDWLLPGLIVVSGTYLNVHFTRKAPLILGWLGGFMIQAWLRSLIFDTPLSAGLLPMTGVAFILFTFYMISDPGTTPLEPRAQVEFGLAVAAVYALLMMVHVVFGLFFALTLVCVLRGARLYLDAFVTQKRMTRPEVRIPAVAGRSDL